ncbi:MAG: hypothetical protein E7544_01385 [Ruminococcaceae bacterium]|nr:hypothetical protein [Oscillospiraceae bacterium]
MRNTKTTKYALVSSVISIFLCAVMLIGTTFAWFTDTASTNVNTIQSGTLDLALVNDAGESLEGKTLEWVKAEGAAEDEAVLWEPGCTYETSAAKIKNEGSLAFKYKIIINGIDGNAKLLDVIDFKVLVADEEIDIADFEGTLLPKDEAGFAIVAHMDEEAGNEYQGLTIDNISIVIKATQLDYEYDSNGNEYDKDASVDDVIIKKTIVLTDENSADAIKIAADEDVTLDMNSKTLRNTIVNNGVLDAGGGDIDYTADRAITNNGKAVFSDIDMNIGSPAAYGFVANAGSETTFDNVNITAGGGAIGGVEGAKIIFNDGSIAINSTQTSPRYLFYLVGEGTELIINDGDFSFDQYRKRSYVCALEGAVAIINGGTFGPAPNHSKWSKPFNVDETSSIIIKGGTFGFNPSEWLADGYEAVESGGVWTVSAK